MSKTYVLSLRVLALLFLSGCQTQMSGFLGDGTVKTTEDLLEADGKWKLAQNKKVLDPLEVHMRARRQVDPHDFKKTKFYTARGKPNDEIFHQVVYLPEPVLKSAQKKMMPAKEDLIVPASMRSIAEEKSRKILQKPQMLEDSNVVSVRVGQHPDKTRIVLDVSARSEFSYDVDADKNLLYVLLPDAKWQTQNQKVIDSAKLVSAYMAKPYEDKGSLVAFRLERPSKIIFSTTYEPEKGRGHRILIDVAPL